MQWYSGAYSRCRREGVTREDTMAVYDFKCKKCGAEFEITCPMDERKDKAVCPKCGSHKVKQKLSAAFSSPRPAKY
jgi:putative FmdB family regulatory protein